MVTIQAISAGAYSISTPFLPLFIQQLGVHQLSRVEEWAGIIGSVNFIMAAIFAPVWGALADRVGRKAMVVRSSVGGGIASVLMGLSGNVFELTGARALMGMFGGFSSAATALVASQVPGSFRAGLDGDRTDGGDVTRAARRRLDRRRNAKLSRRLLLVGGRRFHCRNRVRILRARAVRTQAA
jgi:MFS family permease